MFPTIETDFGANMLLHGALDESVVVSPISVIFALAMLEAGAKGKTKSQIANVIAKESFDADLQNHYSNLSSQIQQARNDVKAYIANGFFLNKQYTIDKEYENTIVGKYSANVQSLDFTSTSDAAKTINDFIESTTQGKIRNMIDPSMADFMNAYSKHEMYVEDEDVQMLSLSYEDTSFAFNIILPKTRFGLSQLRSKFTGSKIQRLLSEMKLTFLTYKIPKMRIETDFKLKEALIAMGVSEMFSGGADFSGITKSPPLRISDAVHRAIIEVDEEGTTASAATGFVAAGSAFTLDEPKKFEADHPFWFILTKDNNPLFMGQFV
ncbi:hypothetical protein Q1695_004111 [Nippostrongylus brasiliensis]|nr:hypothetical protein Q1695_004111 [Nippostrongylus brasiliensis]